MRATGHREGADGFTLVEMLVSMAVLALILLVLSQTTGALQLSVSQTTGQVHEFQAAQDAFESMTRRIGQATLNTYNDTAANTGLTVPGYTRASELRFISGPASLNSIALNGVSGPLFTGTNPYHPTQAIFFQAPLGQTQTSSYANLVQMMNTCGYYIEWNSDTSTGLGIVPSFIPSTYVAHWRYRLMELIEPSENLTIYNYTSGVHGTSPNQFSNSWLYQTKEWFQTPLSNVNKKNPFYRPIADNIIALAFLPMVAPQNAQYPNVGGAQDGTSTDLMVDPSGAAGYLYDTAPVQSGVPPLSQNQLPPMVYVMMIAVDEKSFSTYQAQRGNSTSAPSNLGIDSPGGGSSPFTTSTYTQRQQDVQAITTALNQNHIKYRIFATAVPLTSH